MKVLKFGGTSVGTAESLAHVKEIVEALTEPAVVVVSALGGLTDKLISTAKLAAGGDASFRDEMERISERHHKIISDTVAPAKRKEVLAIVEPLLAELANLYKGVALIGTLPEQTLDQIVSYGERISSVIVSRIVEGAVHYDSLKIVKTEKWFNRNIADSALTERLIRETIKPDAGRVAICGGFIATDRDTGEITNLGRGGSDYTAALIAAALNADILEIWTDVDGFMTADPRIIPGARVIDTLSFVESMELCSFGAKVVYPPTIYPVFHKNIPIRILNTFRPKRPGTLIADPSKKKAEEISARGVSVLRGVSLIELYGPGIENVPEINSRSFNALAKNGVSVLLVSQPTPAKPFSFAIASADSENALKALYDEFAPDMENGSVSEIRTLPEKAILAVVGESIGSVSGIGARISNTLQRAGIRVGASTHGASSANHSCVVAETDANEALRLVHEMFFE